MKMTVIPSSVEEPGQFSPQHYQHQQVYLESS